ncbi:MAG: chromate transporter, partial [Thermotoga sp.]|nr:chromate transporter [Thermotoga sp.]
MLKLAFIFLKVGFLSFGGGWAIVGILKNELVTGGFLSPEEFSQAVSIAQMTPGPVAINLATYTGYKF